MPILGLFPSQRESAYEREVGDYATGRRSSPAMQDIRQNADLARREAFTQAYQSRGNQALARRQAMDVGRDVTMQAGQQMARQRTEDVNAARAEQQRLEQQRLQGINNLIGYGAIGASLLPGSPAAPVAQAATSLVNSSNRQPQPTQQAAPQPTRSAFSMDSLPGMSAQDARQQLVGNAPPAPVQPRADLQQYMMPAQPAAPTTPQVGIDPNDPFSGLMTADQALTDEYLLQGLDPNFVQRMTRNAASRRPVRR